MLLNDITADTQLSFAEIAASTRRNPLVNTCAGWLTLGTVQAFPTTHTWHVCIQRDTVTVTNGINYQIVLDSTLVDIADLTWLTFCFNQVGGVTLVYTLKDDPYIYIRRGSSEPQALFEGTHPHINLDRASVDTMAASDLILSYSTDTGVYFGTQRYDYQDTVQLSTDATQYVLHAGLLNNEYHWALAHKLGATP